jgi:hypothetical protein
MSMQGGDGVGGEVGAGLTVGAPVAPKLQGPVNIQSYAAFALIIPCPYSSSLPEAPRSKAVVSIAMRIFSATSLLSAITFTNALNKSAATPATWGVAILVPL